jgi:hypothetical protein
MALSDLDISSPASTPPLSPSLDRRGSVFSTVPAVQERIEKYAPSDFESAVSLATDTESEEQRSAFRVGACCDNLSTHSASTTSSKKVKSKSLDKRKKKLLSSIKSKAIKKQAKLERIRNRKENDRKHKAIARETKAAKAAERRRKLEELEELERIAMQEAIDAGLTPHRLSHARKAKMVSSSRKRRSHSVAKRKASKPKSKATTRSSSRAKPRKSTRAASARKSKSAMAIARNSPYTMTDASSRIKSNRSSTAAGAGGRKMKKKRSSSGQSTPSGSAMSVFKIAGVENSAYIDGDKSSVANVHAEKRQQQQQQGLLLVHRASATPQRATSTATAGIHLMNKDTLVQQLRRR